MRIAKEIRKNLHYDLAAQYENIDIMLKRVWALEQNNMMLKYTSQENWLESDMYRYYKDIHGLIELSDIVEKHEFERVGKENDGGYVMVKMSDETCFSRNPIAYSIGIGDDVSWDDTMVRNGYEVFMYDHTISDIPHQNEHFHFFRKGITGQLNNTDCCLMRLDEMLDSNAHQEKNGIVLKMDVEGFEWEVINSTSKEILKKFDQIVMEMHCLTEYDRREEIMNALKKLSDVFAPVHIHPNNWGFVDFIGDMIMPTMLEVTWVNRELFNTQRSNKLLPMPFDQCCVSRLPEIKLGKWNC